ncbi:peptide ABC transporter permease, partial [Streptomyces sp. NRRL F-6602]
MPDKTADMEKKTEEKAVMPSSTEVPLTLDAGPAPGKPRSLWSDAWHDLRRSPLFVVSALMILFLIVMAIWPGLFTGASPRDSDLKNHFLQHPNWTHFFQADWFGYDLQG